jgi:hypothetical protein
LRALTPSMLSAVWWHALDGSAGEPTCNDMSAPDRKGLDVEAILNDLYASEINASISWMWEGGFHVILGAPPQAEGWALPTIGAAVVWLRDQAWCITPIASSRGNTAALYS